MTTRYPHVAVDLGDGNAFAILGAVRTAFCRAKVPADDPEAFSPAFDLPVGYVCGWIWTAIYVGVSPDGEISS